MEEAALASSAGGSSSDSGFGSSATKGVFGLIQSKLDSKFRKQEIKTGYNQQLQFQRQTQKDQEAFFQKHNVPLPYVYGVKPMLRMHNGAALPHYTGYQPDKSMVQDRLGIY